MAQAAQGDVGERRRRVITVSAILLVVIATAAMSGAATHRGPVRAVDITRDAGLLLLTLVLALRATTSFSFLKRNSALDDELARAHRASAARAGFWALLVGTGVAFIAGLYIDLPLPQIAPLLLAVGASGAGFRFAALESRAG
ncbi:MAG TPA: hypothetical protein VG841_08260 [Caulobacterales bacterium]|nr:hypothetical protein [Caulobacterales bacterium]